MTTNTSTADMKVDTAKMISVLTEMIESLKSHSVFSATEQRSIFEGEINGTIHQVQLIVTCDEDEMLDVNSTEVIEL